MQRELISEWRRLYECAAVAPSWLEAHQWAYGPQIAQATAADVRRKLDLHPQDRVLEVGAGSGAFLMRLLYPKQQAIAVDFCESLVRQKTRYGVDETRVKFAVAEGVHLPLRSDSFDKVLCYSVAHHFPDFRYAKGVLDQLLDVCRVNGIVLFGDVCGVMERHRKWLISRGAPSWAADALILAAAPVRSLRWTRARRKNSHWYRTYVRGFFARALRNVDCEVEFLDQQIPGRHESQGRFDVRIVKRGSLRRTATQLAMLCWTTAETLAAAWTDLRLLAHG